MQGLHISLCHALWTRAHFIKKKTCRARPGCASQVHEVFKRTSSGHVDIDYVRMAILAEVGGCAALINEQLSAVAVI